MIFFYFLKPRSAAGQQEAALLSVKGAAACGLLRTVARPTKPKDETFEEMAAVLQEHFEPQPLLAAERLRFNRWNRKANQPDAQHVAELEQRAANRELDANVDASPGRPVSGTRKEACQRRLLSQNGLTFAKACEMALNMETAHRHARQLRDGEPHCGSCQRPAGEAAGSQELLRVQRDEARRE